MLCLLHYIGSLFGHVCTHHVYIFLSSALADVLQAAGRVAAAER